jgi:hypothetical protein
MGSLPEQRAGARSGQGASKKKEKENKGQKNNPKKQPTGLPFFFFF